MLWRKRHLPPFAIWTALVWFLPKSLSLDILKRVITRIWTCHARDSNASGRQCSASLQSIMYWCTTAKIWHAATSRKHCAWRLWAPLYDTCPPCVAALQHGSCRWCTCITWRKVTCRRSHGIKREVSLGGRTGLSARYHWVEEQNREVRKARRREHRTHTWDVCVAYCIRSVISPVSKLNRSSISRRPSCHIPLKTDQLELDWEWRMRSNDTSHAIIGCIVTTGTFRNISDVPRMPYLYRSISAKEPYY